MNDSDRCSTTGFGEDSRDRFTVAGWRVSDASLLLSTAVLNCPRAKFSQCRKGRIGICRRDAANRSPPEKTAGREYLLWLIFQFLV